MLEREIWLDCARASNAGAALLATAAGGRLIHPAEANEVFLRVTPDEAAALRAKGFDFYEWGPGEARFVTSWGQDMDDVGRFAAAIEALRPGGIVAYVTCSPHLAETAAIVADARRTFGDVIEELDTRAVVAAISDSPIDLAVPADGSGRAQLWPHRHGTDAMSISLLRKR
jgi:hypothetical protein